MTDIDDLILAGAVEVAAIDSETGEFLYQFTDKLKEVNPELYRRHANQVHMELMYFWQRGFLNIHNFSEDNPVISLTEKAFDKNAISELSEHEKAALEEIKRVLKVV
jgi:hypothetical protein